MKRIACPHCDFLNFEISAYCGRCERPLPKAPPRPLLPKKPATNNARGGPSADAGTLTLRKVPAPAPPVLRDVAPAPLPIEIRPVEPVPPPPPAPGPPPLHGSANRIGDAITETLRNEEAFSNLPEAALHLDTSVDAVEAIEAANRLSPDDQPAQIEIPVHPASWVQIIMAGLVDTTLALIVGVAGVWLETVIFNVPWQRPKVGVGDLIAEWLHAHPDVLWHGVVVVLVVSAIHNILTARRGRTIGRSLAGTVLVRACGHRLGWTIITARAIASVFSLALFGAGFLWAIVDRQHRTWHDLLTGTVVVKRRVRL
ncbi:MAG: hypothetical protein A2341_11105 [Deltaproteobacteria bacterium RIFOXYB12_FULL_58_9]|nr:MAG: hypothetical protein A2341_11105 [Deltaproteobacteria bacterium RIFOXYB12_FULL_58_9]